MLTMLGSPGTGAVRGLVVAHDYGFPHHFFQNGELRRMLAANNCGLVLSSAKTSGFSKPAQFLAAISSLAVASGHAELANAPLLPVGHSNGTAWSNGFAAEYPAIAALVFSKSRSCALTTAR